MIDFRNIPDVNAYYDEPHRYYHNALHLASMITHLYSVDFGLTKDEKYIVQVATHLHDAIYNPLRNDNESRSASLVDNYVFDDEVKQVVKSLIHYTNPSTYNDQSVITLPIRHLIQVIRTLDLWDLIDGHDTGRSIYNGMQILKEFQMHPWGKLGANRNKFLQELQVIDIIIDKHVTKSTVEFMMRYRPKIGIYAGSFNPFHIGHLSVLEQVDKMFDQLIIAVPKGVTNIEELRATLPVHQVVEFEGSLPSLIKQYQCQDGGDVTLIRGMRDQNDLIYERNLYNIYTDMGMKCNVIYIMTQYPHVSSTVIRSMIKDEIDWGMYKVSKYSYLNHGD